MLNRGLCRLPGPAIQRLVLCWLPSRLTILSPVARLSTSVGRSHGVPAAPMGRPLKPRAAPSSEAATEAARPRKRTKSSKQAVDAHEAEAKESSAVAATMSNGAASEPGPAAAQPTGGGAAGEEAGAGAPAVVVEGAPDAVPSAGAKKSRKKAAPRVERVVYSESLRKPLPEDHSGPITKVMTWNVAGLRGLLRKNPTAIAQLIAREAPDVLCLQETKISDEHTAGLEAELQLPPGWHAAWSCGSKKGYAGVATLSRLPPLSVRSGLGVEEHDQEGRLLLTEYPALSVVNTYVPNSSAELKRLGYRVDPGGWDDAFSQALRRWDQEKAVVVAGDLNCAHQEIDIHNPKTNLRSAGFTQEERDSFGTRLLGARETGGAGLVDVLRMQHPEVQAYTYYSFRFQCRAKGIGWRLDYTLLSPKLIAQFHDAYILPDVEGSDHVPLGVTLLTDLQAPLPASAQAGEAS
ncbi:Endonuclease/exonuclease/phosphatase [Haematococcus lacustris]